MSKGLLKFSLAALALSLLTACIHSPTRVFDSSLEKGDPSKIGYIAGSVTGPIKGRRYSSQGIYVCNAKQDIIFEFGFTDNWAQKEKPDINSDGVEGKTFTLPLPEGEYYFCDFWFFANGGTYSTGFSAENKFSIPFQVKAGAVSYIGEFLGISATGRNIFGISVRAGGYWVVSNKRERDMPLISLKNKDIAARPLIMTVPQIDDYHLPFMRSTALPEMPGKPAKR